MWLLSSLVFLPPMRRSRTLLCPSFPMLSFRLCHYQKPPTDLNPNVKHHSFSLSYHNQYISFIWFISSYIPCPEAIMFRRDSSSLILRLSNLSNPPYVFAPLFSLLKFPHQSLLSLYCIRFKLFCFFLTLSRLFFVKVKP